MRYQVWERRFCETLLPSSGANANDKFCIKRPESEVAQSCPTLCDPVDCSPPCSYDHGILQARILEWVAISFSRGPSQPRDQTRVSRIGGRYFNLWAPREAGISENNLPAMQETWIPSLGWEDPLEEGMTTHSSIPAWRIPTYRGAWWATVHGVTKSQTRLSR